MKVKITATVVVETVLTLEELQEDYSAQAFEYLMDRLESDDHDDENKILVEELPS